MAEVSLKAKIWGDVSELLTSLQKAEKAMNGFSRKMTAIGKELSTGLTLPIAAFGVMAVKEFGESEKASASLAAQIRANGKDVESTMSKYDVFAKGMQKLTTVEDDVVIGFLQLAESMQAPDTEKAVKDAIGLSKAYGIEMPQAVKMSVQAQMGQFTMLGRLVPAIRGAKDATEKATIAEKLFADGFQIATAQAQAGLGPLEQLKNDIGNLSESFGEIILKGLTPFVNGAKAVATWLDSLSESTKKWVVGITMTVAAIGPMFLIIGKVPAVLAALSGGFRVAIGAMKALWVVAVANPWVALAVVIIAVAAALALFAGKASAAERVQKSLNDVNDKAQQSIASEKVQLESLMAIATDETKSKDERAKAIKRLNDLSPKYLGDLKLETINTDQAKKATNEYIQSLLVKAKVMAAEERLVEIEKELLALQSGQSEAADPTIWQDAANAVMSFGNTAAYVYKTAGTTAKNYSAEIDNLTKEQKALTGVITANSGVVLDNTKITGDDTGGKKEQKTLVQTLEEEISKLNIQLIEEVAANSDNAAITGELIRRKQNYVDQLKAEAEALKKIKDLQAIEKLPGAGTPTVTGAPTTLAPLPPVANTGVASGPDDSKVELFNEALEKTVALTSVINNSSFSGLYNAFLQVGQGVTSLVDSMGKQFTSVKEKVAAIAGAIGQMLQGVLSAWSQISSQNIANETARLDAYYGKERDLINGSMMSQQAKQKALQKLDAESDKKRRVLMRKQAKDNKTASLISAIIAGAVAVVQALTIPGAGIALAVIVGALAAAQIALIAATPLPELAEGGLATSPTLAMVGDNPNAAVDPEVISPLSKLKKMIGGAGTTVVEVVGRVSGKDLLWVMQRAEVDRFKVTG